MSQPQLLRIGIDLDDTITYAPAFFAAMTRAMRAVAEIHIITNRERTAASRANTARELDELGVAYHHLEITADKATYIARHGITVYFDDTDDYFLELPESVTVFKIREPWNFDFENCRWHQRGVGEVF